MKRDIICILRVLADSIPDKIRNSLFLFKIAQKLFNIPEDLYYFRENYFNCKIKNLESLYIPNEKNDNLLKLSKDTDINSHHIKLIENEVSNVSTKNILDIGCGNGYLLTKLYKKNKNIEMTGIDLYPNPISSCYKHIHGNLIDNMSSFADGEFDLVICAHVLEHLKYPQRILKEIRRISKKKILIICPLEKNYKWGMNYHVQFFPTKEDFYEFASKGKNNSMRNQLFIKLGDALYVEEIA
tara:strand:- start:112 stop:834 length:723 start_codon:yes stop_codon:yes gene_type:complete